MKLSEFCIRRPVFATVLSLMLVIFGLVTLERLPLREYPDINRPVVSITTIYRGASANVVENKVTQVIEDRIAGVEGILKLESDSADERSSIRVEFDVARDIGAQMAAGNRCIFGVMVESHLHAGNQKFTPGKDDPAKLDYGRSITDACIGWDDSLNVLDILSAAVKARRRHVGVQG